MPLEQYDDQFSRAVWNKVSDSLYPQIETDLWRELYNKLQNELWQETLRFTLKEELRNQCL